MIDERVIDIWKGMTEQERDALRSDFYAEFHSLYPDLFEKDKREYHRQAMRYVMQRFNDILSMR